MNYLRQTLTYAFLTIVLIITGSLGYMVIEGWGPIDALYMTVITLTTVGYGEVHLISAEGRVFTIILIFLGTLACRSLFGES